MQYPKTMQPTHARWEHLPPADSRAASKLTKGLSTLTLDANETTQPEPEPEPEPTLESDKPNDSSTTTTSIPAALTRRFAIHDTHYESPPYSNQGLPGPDGDVLDLGANGLVSIAGSPPVPEFAAPEILAELPPECKEALVDAAAREWQWKAKWRSEVDDGRRAQPLKSYSWFP